MIAFDCPSAFLRDKPYATRYQFLKDNIAEGTTREGEVEERGRGSESIGVIISINNVSRPSLRCSPLV